jgi:hypothetical protein
MSNLLKIFYQRVNQIFRDAIALDVRVDLVLMIAVITQRIEDLRECEVRRRLGISSAATPIRQVSTIARTGVRVPLMIGSPLKILLSVTT